jgi:hypothetical protein
MFDPAILNALRNDKEVRFRTGSQTKGVIIWIVTVGDEVFVRSVRGAKGKWHAAASATGEAALEVAGRSVSVRATPVGDAATIDAVSKAYLAKYAGSPYAQSIVAPDTLPTTLRLEPR